MDEEFGQEFNVAEHQAFQWIIGHEKPGAVGDYVGGFGRGGIYSLRIPSNAPTTRQAIRAGKLIVEEIPGVETDPKIARLASAVTRCVAEAGPGLLALPACLVEYASALIQRNYNVSDADLTMLLTSDPELKWGLPMAQHAMGGEWMIKAFAAGGPAIQAMQASAEADLPPPSPAPIILPPIKRRWLDRFRRK